LLDDINELKAKMLPALAIRDAIIRDCPEGVKCNPLVHVIYYPRGKPSGVVSTQRDWWLSL